MGLKSRSNYPIGICLKKDCVNKDKKCDKCIKYSEYKKSR